MLDALFEWLWRHRHRVRTSGLVFASLAEGGALVRRGPRRFRLRAIWIARPAAQEEAKALKKALTSLRTSSMDELGSADMSRIRPSTFGWTI
jgi:hypothetical protein